MGGIPFIVTHDGRSIRYPDPGIKSSDTVMIEVNTQNIRNYAKFELGNISIVVGGHNAGRVGLITRQEKHPGSNTIVTIRDATGNSFATRKDNVFVIGKGNKPLVSLPRGNGVRLTIIQEQMKHFKTI